MKGGTLPPLSVSRTASWFLFFLGIGLVATGYYEGKPGWLGFGCGLVLAAAMRWWTLHRS